MIVYMVMAKRKGSPAAPLPVEEEVEFKQAVRQLKNYSLVTYNVTYNFWIQAEERV